jgi:hypothetical protein
MKKSIFSAIAGLVVFAITGCTSVKFYSDSGLTANTGLKYYTVKPYLLVEREIANNSIVKATVIYLPDLSDPQYMVVKPGLGSAKVSLKLEDGAVNTFGMDSDTKIAETLESLGTFLAKSAGAVVDLSAIKSPQRTDTGTITITELYEVCINPGKQF